jgi:hypothetical protein
MKVYLMEPSKERDAGKESIKTIKIKSAGQDSLHEKNGREAGFHLVGHLKVRSFMTDPLAVPEGKEMNINLSFSILTASTG